MGIVYALGILLMGLTLLIGIISVIVLLIMIIMKKNWKIPAIITGSIFGLFVISLITVIIISINNEGNTIALYDNPNQIQETVTDPEDDEDIVDQEEYSIDFDEYKELDARILSTGEYEKQTSLKYSNAEVLAIISDDEIGNQIVAVNLDDQEEFEDGIVIHDAVGRSEIIEGGIYTFYGPPDNKGRLILIGVEEE